MSSRRLLVTLCVPLLLVTTRSALAEFTDATSSSGLFGGQPTWGAQIVDMDADGDLDVFNGHHFYSGFLFTNDGTGHLSVWGLDQIIASGADRHAYLWADLTGDGLLEVVCSHGGSGGCGCQDDGNELWTSTAPGVFQVVADAGGMLDPTGRGRTFSAADIDGDGDLDLHHGKAPLAGYPNSLYRNDGGNVFVDVAPLWGVDEELGTVGAHFIDYDDDGDPDLFVGGEEFDRPTVLYRNDGTSFTDVTAAAFGSLPVIAGADWGDYDSDGDLDLALCEGAEGIWDTWQLDGSNVWFFANHRFGDDGVDIFTFDTVGGEDPVAQLRWGGQFVSTYFFLGPNAVHPMGASWTLTDDYVGAPAFTPGVDAGIYLWREAPGGAWQVHVSSPPGMFGNYSGRLITTGGIVSPGASNLETLSVSPSGPRLFRNDGGVFQEVTATKGFTLSANPRSVSWVDFDNDGDLDLHQVNKGTIETGNEPDILWRNEGIQFRPLGGPTWVPGLDNHFSDGGVWADLDLDGDLDLMQQEGAGPNYFSFGTPALLYRNDGPVGNWFSVSLGSASGGATAVGTKVTLCVDGSRIERRVTANGWRGFQRPLALHFGLGEATLVDSLIVDWPSGNRQEYGPFVANVALRFDEDNAPTTVESVSGPSNVSFVGRVSPQPSRGTQSLAVRHSDDARIQVDVFDVTGRRVRALTPLRPSKSETLIQWDGRDEFGRRVPAGVYFLRGMGDVRFVEKAVRLR